MTFGEFFRRGTGQDPFPYQRRLAEAEAGAFPRVLRVPTGSGKTLGVVLAWLWRRRYHASQVVRGETPRRLVYCLPTRVLVEQTADVVTAAIKSLGLAEGCCVDPEAGRGGNEGPPVPVVILMGGHRDWLPGDPEDWLLRPAADMIIVGTQDMLLSRALNRGYGSTRFAWPREFGLLNNDALWVYDEIQLMGSGLATSVQLEAFRRRLGTFGPTGSLWLSATLEPAWLATIDHPEPDSSEVAALGDEDLEHPHLMRRLQASKSLLKLGLSVPVPPKKGEAETFRPALEAYAEKAASWVLANHAPGTLTLVIVNTVTRAKEIYKKLVLAASTAGAGPHVVLLHSHFRPPERARAVEQALSDLPAEGRIVVSTQVVEAGVDISARVLLTELAPWTSVIQRLGRCNRYGEVPDAMAAWVDVPEGAAAPYENQELRRCREKLEELGARGGPGAVTPRDLASETCPPPRSTHVLRQTDLVGLFDTTPDLSGYDVDVSRYVRDAEEQDVQVFWREWGAAQPPEELAAPSAQELCTAPIADLRPWVRRKRVWTWDHLAGGWVTPKNLFPGMVLLARASDGGYDPLLGWEPEAKGPVQVVDTPEAPGEPGRGSAAHGRLGETAPTPEEGMGDDLWSSRVKGLVTIAHHSEATVSTLRAMLKELSQGLGSEYIPRDVEQAVLLGARWHDRGKAHRVFQESLAAKLSPQQRVATAGLLLAKAGAGRIRHGRKHFRHELASALALLQSSEVYNGVVGLAAYLAAAHHGKVRLSIRSYPDEVEPPEHPNRRFAAGIWDGDELPETDLGGGCGAPAVRLDLSVSELGGGRPDRPSWLSMTLSLRDSPELGPFRLALLEALVRAADVRASIADGGEE